MDTKTFTQQGKYLMLAFDHRGSFKKMLSPENPDVLEDKQVIEAKEKIIRPLIGQFSGILVDPVWGLKAYNQAVGLDEKKPFLLCTEKSGYQEKEGGRYTAIQYPASELKSMGASGIKLLLYFNPYDQSAQHQLSIGKQALEDAHSNDLPLFIEFVSYEIVSKQVSRSELVLKSVEYFIKASVVPDVWKLEYPGDAETCKKINDLVSPVPWILLTRGAKYNVFKKQLEEAVAGGAVGFLAGRALWQEAMKMSGQEQDKFLNQVLIKRFQEISEIVLK